MTRKFMAQESGTCCFVYAVANAVIAVGGHVPRQKFEDACDVACCRTGNTIHHARVVEFLNADLEEVEEDRVFEHGGILSIKHPIFNGHAFYIEPQANDRFLLVNSWLGPNVMSGIGRSEVERFLNIANIGSHWARRAS